MDKRQLRQFPHLRQRKNGRSPEKTKPSAFESEIPPLHKSAIYDKRVFRPPGARKREEVTAWRGILSSG